MGEFSIPVLEQAVSRECAGSVPEAGGAVASGLARSVFSDEANAIDVAGWPGAQGTSSSLASVDKLSWFIDGCRIRFIGECLEIGLAERTDVARKRSTVALWPVVRGTEA